MKLTNTQMENLWWKYKTEGIAKNLSLQAFCSIHDVPYNQFEKFLKMRKDLSEVHKVNITDIPDVADSIESPAHQQSSVQDAKAGQTDIPTSREMRLSFRRQQDTHSDDTSGNVEKASRPESPLRIMVNIRMTNGMQISKRNMDYRGLRSLVEKLEALC